MSASEVFFKSALYKFSHYYYYYYYHKLYQHKMDKNVPLSPSVFVCTEHNPLLNVDIYSDSQNEICAKHL